MSLGLFAAAVAVRLAALAILGLSLSTAQSLFYVEVRHRGAVEPLLGIFPATAVGGWLPAADSRTLASS